MVGRFAVSVIPGCSTWLAAAAGQQFEVIIPDEDAAIVRELHENIYGLGAEQFAEPATVLDLGAHVGVFTLAALAHGATRVVAVEPNPANFELLRLNIQTNADRWDGQVEMLHAAVGAGARAVSVGSGSTARTRPARSGVPVLGPGSLLAQLDGEVAVLKLDVEGAEYEFFDQAPAEALARCRRIVLEWHPFGAEPEAWGRMVAKLAENHRVTTVGHASKGGIIYADLYGGGAA